FVGEVVVGIPLALRAERRAPAVEAGAAGEALRLMQRLDGVVTTVELGRLVHPGQRGHVLLAVDGELLRRRVPVAAAVQAGPQVVAAMPPRHDPDGLER